MEVAKKQSHLTFGDRQIIQKGIENGSSKKAIADLLGKDKSTIGKEIERHRELAYKFKLPLECAAYPHCRFNRICTTICFFNHFFVFATKWTTLFVFYMLIIQTNK